jgi:hypothetical protein
MASFLNPMALLPNGQSASSLQRRPQRLHRQRKLTSIIAVMFESPSKKVQAKLAAFFGYLRQQAQLDRAAFEQVFAQFRGAAAATRRR